MLTTMAAMSGRQSTDALINELGRVCRSELTLSHIFPENRLREILERYGCAPNNNLNIDRYTFFFLACENELMTEGILRCLLEYFPNAASDTHSSGVMPLHVMCCCNKNVTLGMVQLLIEACPESIDRTNNGVTPLHALSKNGENLDDSVAVDILGFLLERCPEAVRRADDDGHLPIHLALMSSKSFEFCRMLIEAYPGSERIATSGGFLPLHIACRVGAVVTVEYLLKLYPESINLIDGDGGYPIHEVITRVRNEPTIALEMVQMLLDCDPNVAFQKGAGILPLSLACSFSADALAMNPFWGDDAIDMSRVNAALKKIAQVLYDEYPEAIEDIMITAMNRLTPEGMQAFINTKRTIARQARNTRQMNTPDENGKLPLHRALRDNITLGSIKLLVKGNPTAVQTPDNDGALPLHLAIQHHDSSAVVEYLIGLDSNSLTAVDRAGNTALHVACRIAKYDIIALLLENYDALSVSKRNDLNKLPIDLLFGSDSVSDREGIDYTGSIFQLIRAYPESVMGSVVNMRQEQQSRVPLDGKKRKLDQM